MYSENLLEYSLFRINKTVVAGNSGMKGKVATVQNGCVLQVRCLTVYKYCVKLQFCCLMGTEMILSDILLSCK
jgi:hypothetical protein